MYAYVRVSEPLKLELQTVVSCHWLLETELGSSGRTAINC